MKKRESKAAGNKRNPRGTGGERVFLEELGNGMWRDSQDWRQRTSLEWRQRRPEEEQQQEQEEQRSQSTQTVITVLQVLVTLVAAGVSGRITREVTPLQEQLLLRASRLTAFVRITAACKAQKITSRGHTVTRYDFTTARKCVAFMVWVYFLFYFNIVICPW